MFVFLETQVTVDGNNVRLEILDTAGQAEFSAFRDTAIGYADGFLVVFSIVDRGSFEEAKRLVQQVKDENKKPVLVAGNKLVRDDDAFLC